MKRQIAAVGCAWLGALLLAAYLVVMLLVQTDRSVQAQVFLTDCETYPCAESRGFVHVLGQTMHPQPMSLPTGIDIVQVVRAHDGTFLVSCTNGLILWAQRVDTHGWVSNWITTEWEDKAEGNDWTLLTADREVWAYDSRKLIRVWE